MSSVSNSLRKTGSLKRGWSLGVAVACLSTVVPATLMFMCLLCGPSSALAGSSGKARPKLYAVIVGVAKYQDKSILPLEVSAKDAQDFAAFLSDRNGLFDGKPQVTLMVNEQATRANVTKSLRQLLKPAEKDDFVIIYLSGHGAADPSAPNEYYFLTHDARIDNLFGTAVLMNDTNLFKQIRTDKVLMIADSCYAAGFVTGIQNARPKAARRFFSIFQALHGRVALASSRADEESWENPRFGNSVFTHFLLKGLRGEANLTSKDGLITAAQLYEYVYNNTEKSTEGKQHPQIYSAKGSEDPTPVFVAPTYDRPLSVKVQFQYLDDDDQVRPLTDSSVLRSGQRCGVSFRPDGDCYVYIFWWDSSGQVGRLFPNPELTEGSPAVRGGQTYWLPLRQGEKPQYRWYVLDDVPGEETFYFVASRSPNEKIERLYNKLCQANTNGEAGAGRKQLAREMEREFNLMGVARFTATADARNVSAKDRESLFQSVQSEIEVVRADVSYCLKFRHVQGPNPSK